MTLLEYETCIKFLKNLKTWYDTYDDTNIICNPGSLNVFSNGKNRILIYGKAKTACTKYDCGYNYEYRDILTTTYSNNIQCYDVNYLLYAEKCDVHNKIRKKIHTEILNKRKLECELLCKLSI